MVRYFLYCFFYWIGIFWIGVQWYAQETPELGTSDNKLLTRLMDQICTDCASSLMNARKLAWSTTCVMKVICLSGSSATSGYSSRASSPHDLSDVDDVDDGVVFESTKPLIHTLEYILCVQEMCDVTFLAGKKKEPVYGLQAVMGSRSRWVSRKIYSLTVIGWKYRVKDVPPPYS